MSEIVVVANLRARPEKVDEARDALHSLVEPTHAEEGNIMYALHQGIEDPTRLTFVERWVSAEALEQHMGTEHLQGLLGRVDELLTEPPDITTLAPVLGGQERKGSIAGHAGG